MIPKIITIGKNSVGNDTIIPNNPIKILINNMITGRSIIATKIFTIAYTTFFIFFTSILINNAVRVHLINGGYFFANQ